MVAAASRSVFLPHTFRRPLAMSTSSLSAVNPWAEKLPKPIPELGTYLALLPDFIEGSKRMDVRPIHLEHAAAGHANGWIVQAGATFGNDPVADGTAPKMTGSWFLLREESLEKARERLSRDIYVTGGAWDMSKATITAVAVAKH